MSWQQELDYLVDDGMEYPDAEMLVSMKHGISVDDIRDYYDNQ